MNSLQKIEYWADHHHPKWLDILRISLGLILIIKGINLIFEKDAVVSLMLGSQSEFLAFIIAHYVIAVHLVGGLAIGLGIATRITALVEIPILVGAMLLLNFSQNFQAIHSGFEFTFLVFVLLVIFFIYGSGPLSVDHYLQQSKEEESWIKIK